MVGLRGNLAPDGAIVKVAGLEKQQFTGTARCFDCEEEANQAIIDGREEDARALAEGAVAGGLDLAAAPRRALVAGMQFALLVLVTLPVLALM